MGSYRSVSNAFIDYKVCCYVLAFLRNHTGIIKEAEFFLPLTSRIPAQKIKRCIKRNFSKSELTKLETVPRTSSRLNWDDPSNVILSSIWETPKARKQMADVVEQMCRSKFRHLERSCFKRDKTKRRLDELQRTLSLTDFECNMIFLAFLIKNRFIEESDKYRCHYTFSDKIIFVAKCIDRPCLEVREAMDSSRKLRRYGLLDHEIALNPRLDGFLCGVGKNPISGQYYQRVSTKPLPWSFYGSLTDKHGEMLKTLIAARDPSRGLNILFYGAPGTGKTSFAHSLAEELGLVGYDIVQNVQGDDKASGYTPEHRFGALEICDAQVEQAKSLIVVDEADEMLRGFLRGNWVSGLEGGGGGGGDKGMLNSVLDRIKTPCIWIANTSAKTLDASSRRLFDYSIRFDPLNASQRLSIWQNNVKQLKLSPLISAEQMGKYAEQYETSAGGISTVLRNFAAIKPEARLCESTIEKLMKPHCELLGIETRRRFAVSGDYSLDGLNIKGDVGLERIVEAIRSFQSGAGRDPDQPRMNLLLSGPPGSGKTEFVKHLGAELSRKVLVKRGSDLLSKWVGGTEANIQQAFEEAEGGVLFFDEIDGLLQSRDRAQHSWEVTQVNELLQRMETFAGIFVAATNFIQNIDPASLRRFTFKLGFDYLTTEGKATFFRKLFKTELTPDEAIELNTIPDLVPGDFRTVRQGLFYLGGTPTHQDLIKALRHEVIAKKQSAGVGGGQRMGFNA